MLQTGIAGLGDQLLGHSAPGYERHQPEQTLLYQIIDKHCPDFLAQLAAEGELLLAMSSGSSLTSLNAVFWNTDSFEFATGVVITRSWAFSCKRRGLPLAAVPVAW